MASRPMGRPTEHPRPDLKVGGYAEYSQRKHPDLGQLRRSILAYARNKNWVLRTSISGNMLEVRRVA